MLPDSCKIDPFYKQSTNVRVAEFLIVLLLNMDGDAGDTRATVTLTRLYHLPALFFFSSLGPKSYVAFSLPSPTLWQWSQSRL